MDNLRLSNDPLEVKSWKFSSFPELSEEYVTAVCLVDNLAAGMIRESKSEEEEEEEEVGNRNGRETSGENRSDLKKRAIGGV